MIDAAGTLAHTTLQVAGALGGTVDQEYLFEARQMQAMSFAFHIILVCFGVALPAIVVFMEGLWLRTGDPLYRALARRWSKAMIALFAIGVVSGTILSFELGMLWPEFMATFGSVFGLGFALEGFSFFIEAIFITIYVYSWGRLPPKVHFLTGLPIIVTGITGSYFVLSVNGWMNNPSGFDLVNGQVTNVDPLAGLITVNSIYELVHMTIAAYMVVGFVVAGIYAWGWLRGRRDRYHRVGFVVAFTVAALAAPVQLLVGDWAAREVAIHQPVKLAAMEGLSETTAGAPFTIGGWYSDGELKGGVEIPKLLSLLAHHDPNSTVTGLDTVPDDDQPPVNVVRLAFHTMVAIGSALALLALWYLLTWLRHRRPPRSKWFYRAAVIAGPAAIIALEAGWVTTEVGRQPWIVYEVLRVEDAVTNASGIPVSYGALGAVYAVLAVAAFWMLRRIARTPLPEPVAGAESLPVKDGTP